MRATYLAALLLPFLYSCASLRQAERASTTAQEQSEAAFVADFGCHALLNTRVEGEQLRSH